MAMGIGAQAAAADPFPGGNSSSFVILSVSVAGILAISLLLLTYYLFLTRCASWRHNQLDDVAHHHRYVVYSPRLEHRRRGLEEAAIRRIPTLRYNHEKAKKAAVASECAVCLGEFSEGERLRRLPACLHAFHIDCIDAWLHATANCPLCRADVVAEHRVIDIASPASPSPPGGDTAEVPAAARVAMSMGDECIDHERPWGVQQPMRRSLSLDSCSDKHLYLALQSAMRHQHQHSALLQGEEEGAKFGESSTAAGSPAAAASGGRRLRRSFFSFSHGRSSRSAILPLPV